MKWLSQQTHRTLIICNNLFFLITTALFFLQVPNALAATEITGTISAKRGDTFKVEFQAHETAGPKIGDEVKFSTTLGGVGEVNAGNGNVIEVGENFVWVQTSDDRPDLKMKAVIHATGSPQAKATRPNSIPPPLHRCDELAGHPWDNQRIGPAVEFSSIKADQAIAACQDAVNEYPQTPRFLSQLGRSHDANKQYDDAFKYYQQAAKHNYVAAQYHIGALYFHGRGVSSDHMEAFKWVRRAAEQGHAVAEFSVGWSYNHGKGVSEDLVEAVKWYRKAAEQGHDGAQGNLGLMYHNGDGVQQDYTEAARWYHKAAAQGSSFAQYNLAVLYKDGLGVQKNNQEAIRLLQEAASQGHEKAKEQLKKLGY